jgi:hypothetical protein
MLLVVNHASPSTFLKGSHPQSRQNNRDYTGPSEGSKRHILFMGDAPHLATHPYIYLFSLDPSYRLLVARDIVLAVGVIVFLAVVDVLVTWNRSRRT